MIDDIHHEVNITLEKIFNNVNDWLKFAEAKNGIIIGLNIAALGAFNSIEILYCYKILYLAIMTCICISILFSLMSFLPQYNAEHNSNSENNSNLLYYKNIAGYSEREYIKEIYKRYFNKEVNSNQVPQLNRDYATEIYINSKITLKKYMLCSYAIKADIVGMILIILTFILSCLL